ncbi:MAG: RNA 2',3'-cyclic phosphodiesterase [Pyrinomonadaceae bacterium]|nr:RNA 2',3'-cyclic phosphodiesterase [Pyrinomonadaceae bacterium]
MSFGEEQQRTQAKPERWRVFFAVELPANLRERAAEHIACLRDALPEVRAGWEREEKMHLTLKFLGEIGTSRFASLSSAAELAAQNFQPFTCGIENAGTFPERGQPRVLWLGVSDASGNLARLQQALENECARAGFAREERAFRPHLTLARVRAPKGARRLAELHQEMGFELMEFPVTEMVLIRSERRPEGSRYTVISRHSLDIGS